MEVLHISDLHLDRAFEGINYLSKEAERALRKSSAQLLDRIIECISKNHIELLLIVGDTFHQSHISYEMQQLWVSFLERCLSLGATPCIIFGNHDYYDEARYFIPWPEGVLKWTSEQVETKYYTSRTGERVALSGFSYCHPHIIEEKIHEFPKRNHQMDYHIGLYHGQVTGKYAPFSKDEMLDKEYDYFALGHIHRYQMIDKNIVYPGTLQGKKQGEWGEGRAILIHLTPNYLRSETIQLAPIRYEIIEKKMEDESFQSIIQQLQLRKEEALYTLVELRLILGVSVSDIAKEELYSNDFKEFLSRGISIGDSASLVKVSMINTKRNTNVLPQTLRNELCQNYKKDNIFQDVGGKLFTDPLLEEESNLLLYHKDSIIEEALQSLEEELGGQRDEI